MVSTLQKMMRSANAPTGEYNFEVDSGRQNPRDVGIPDSLDMCERVIDQLTLHLTDMQAEQHKIDLEIQSAQEQLRKIRIHVSKKMLRLGIPAPMAREDEPPEIIEAETE